MNKKYNFEDQLKYSKPVNKVINHIYGKSPDINDSNLSLDALSQVACYSKFHFHRLFYNEVGVSVNQFVQYLHLKKAAHLLAFFPNRKIVDVAIDVGFKSHEAFTRSFKKYYKLTPSQFRKSPNWEEHFDLGIKYNSESFDHEKIETSFFYEKTLVIFEHKGNSNQLNLTVSKFIDWKKKQDKYLEGESLVFGLIYSESDTAKQEDIRIDIGQSVTEDYKKRNPNLSYKNIPSSKCLKFTHLGPYDQISEKVSLLYKNYISKNGIAVRDFPCFVQYKNFYPMTPESQLLTDVHIIIE